jgi:NAD(P)-dependent dehydrogenase (short-subunit alcohol dehydrogenase family)
VTSVRRPARRSARTTAVRELTVLVTGGGKGLGRAFAEELARAGARVIITGRAEEALVRACAELGAEGLRVSHAVADIAVPGAMTEVVAHVEHTVGALDVLVNNAGVGGPVGPAWEVDQDDWWRSVEINLRGTQLAGAAALSVMVPRGQGRVINIVSHAGRAVWPHVSAYSVAKAAIIKLTENVAAEVRRYGVSVLSYHPGLLDIGLSRANAAAAPTGGEWDRKIASWFAERKAAGEVTPVTQACAMLVRLVGGEADALSGRYLTVDDDLDVMLTGASGSRAALVNKAHPLVSRVSVSLNKSCII